MNALTILLIPGLPLLSFLISGLCGKRMPAGFSGVLGALAIGVSCCLSVYVAYDYFILQGSLNGTYAAQYPFRFDWLALSSSLSVQMGAILDPISVMMLVVVTLISAMVHLYSIAYMHGEKRYYAYFAFLGLFTFSMLMLVLSVNMIQLYIFWELVGISSFLLIGFYYEKPSAVAAAKKAFIVTRFADMFFLIGILLVSWQGGSLDISTLINKLTTPGFVSAVGGSFLGFSLLASSMLLIFIGGAGKSAMFPLHIWLPDAMEGPTPVSALIHAATMVVAGVYLVARLFPVYAIATPQVLEIIAWTGAITSLFAALIACTQFDIKRVLAYSTMSQIGYMLLALGVAGHDPSGFTASMFHLFTHAIFKALLFLGAGAIIHFVHTNDMREMGGLRKRLPLVHITFLIACLAITGIPPFAGFFSKEMILSAAYEANRPLFIIGFITSGFTAFYMFRLYFSIFWRDKAATENHKHAHSSWLMNLPLSLLAIGSIAAGFLPFQRLVRYGAVINEETHLGLIIGAMALIIAGIALATWLYKSESVRPGRIVSRISPLHNFISSKFYIDEIYLFFTKRIIFNIIARPVAWFDRNVVNGAVNTAGNTAVSISEQIKALQSGRLQSYVAYFLAGLLILAIILISL